MNSSYVTTFHPELPPVAAFDYTPARAVVVVEGAPVGVPLTETTTIFFFAPLIFIGAIGVCCWLLFTLAVFALPAYVGFAAGLWSFHTGAGVLGAAIVGMVVAGATFGMGQLLLAFVPWTWARLLIIAAYATPAVVAGYSATHGIAQMVMPSPVWQAIFSTIGAIAVGITALVRICGMAVPPAQSGGA